MKKAICLLSGGLDSSTMLAIAKSEGYELYALTVNYGQRHLRELTAAKAIAKYFSIHEHRIMNVPLFRFGGSALTDRMISLPESRHCSEMSRGIPCTYVPARNMILLSLAFAYAEAIGARAVYIGANAIDFSGYPDCRPEFFESLRKTLAIGTRNGNRISLKTPLIELRKSEIIKAGLALGVPFSLTWSCYRGGKKPCGKCDSCILRAKGFREADAVDPLISAPIGNNKKAYRFPRQLRKYGTLKKS